MKYVLRMKTTQTRDFSKHISLIYKRPGCSAFCNCYLVYFFPCSLQSLCISAHLSYLPDNYKTFNVWFTAQLFQCLVSFISRFCNLLPIWGIMPELQTHQLHWACTSQRGYFPRKAWLQMFISVWHYKETFHNGYISFLHNSALVYDWCIIDTIVAASDVLVSLC